MNYIKISWLLVIAKHLGLKALEFSLTGSQPIKAYPFEPLDDGEMLKYMIGYHMANLYGTIYYASPAILSLKLMCNKQLRGKAKAYKETLKEYSLEKASVYSLILDNVRELFDVIVTNIDDVQNIWQCLNDEDEDVFRVILNGDADIESAI